MPEPLPSWASAIFRAPRHLYAWHAGWLLGHRFLMVEHRGRRSGKRYTTVLEVVHRDRTVPEYVVIAGLGAGADWYRNVRSHATCRIQVGRSSFEASWRDVEPSEAARLLAGYERRARVAAPVLRRVLTSLVGWKYDGSAAARDRLVCELPMLAFRPSSSSELW
ncbi:nitroreductase family deazaflavin-dependent oxidoreductase [Lapillicoccus sp.]|uniref:nitroreductase family deazaflavin-dependent oxidoreductase n=1 Tax=Lapillicoccus sp. TaxID=1909287 RepID=UPI0027D1AD5B|nr:nitroreductase family deazaflavin-dependent oxidoreductase [Actinomycetota bacterium]